MADNDVQALIAELALNTRRIEGQQRRLLASFDRTMGGMEKSGAKRLTAIEKRAEDMSRNVRRAILAIGVGVAGREVLEYEAAWRNTTNTLKQYTDVLGPAQQSASALNAIANDARAPLEELSGLTGAAARSARDLGKSGADVLVFGEAAAKGARLANTGQAAVAGAFTQLSQAIASPRVQLQEFNSIIEGTPRLAQAFADGVDGAGGSVAKLRKLIADGDVSGGDLFDALISQADKLREEFSTLDQGPGEAVTRLRNKLIEFVGTNETVKAGTEGLVTLIDLAADNLDVLTEAVIVGTAALAGFYGAQGLLAVASGLQGVAVGATAGAKAMAVLRAASAFMLGPVGLAVGAAAAAGAIAYLAIRGNEAAKEFEQVRINATTAGTALKTFTETGSTEVFQQQVRDLSKIKEQYYGIAAAAIAAAEAEKTRQVNALLNERQDKAEDLQVLKDKRGNRDLKRAGRTAERKKLDDDIATAEALLAQYEKSIDEISNRSIPSIAEELAKAGRVPVVDADDGDDKDTMSKLTEIREEYRKTYETESEAIARVRDEKLAAINAAKISQTEADELRQQANDVYLAQMEELDVAQMQADNAEFNRLAEKAKAEREAEEKIAADKKQLIDDVMAMRYNALGQYDEIAKAEFKIIEDRINKELTTEEEKNATLLALAETRQRTLAEIEKRMADDRLRAALEEADTLREGFKAQWDIMREESEAAAGDIGILFADTFGPGGYIQEAIGSAAGRAIAFGEDFSESIENAARSIGANLIGALVEYGVQLAIQAAMGKALGASAVVATTAQAAAVSAAWAPAAAAASLATLGSNAAAAAAALTATHALSKALSVVPGFADGVVDFRGKGGPRSDSNTVRISAGESVITAEGTRKNSDLLRLMNDGVDVQARLARAAEPMALDPGIFSAGGSRLSVAGSTLVFNGPVDKSTLPSMQAMLDQRDLELAERMEALIESDRTRTTPRHLRNRFMRG